MKFTTVCAWCDKTIKTEEFDGDKDKISHGMCPACAADIRKEYNLQPATGG